MADLGAQLYGDMKNKQVKSVKYNQCLAAWIFANNLAE